MIQGNLQPLILALAAMVGALTPAIVGLVVGLQTHHKVSMIETQTNGALAALQAEVVALRAEVAGRRSTDKGKGPWT